MDARGDLKSASVSVADEKKGLKSEYGNDGVHPTKEGYDVMEKAVKFVIPGTFK